MRHRVRVTWTLSREAIAAVKERAAERGVSASRLAEQAIFAYLDHLSAEGVDVELEQPGGD